MPGMDGYEVMREVCLRWPYINMIVLSADLYDYAILRSLKCGAKGYLTKNISPEILKEAILEVYSNDYYFSSLVLKKFPGMTQKI